MAEAGGSNDLQICVQAEQRRRRVAGECGPAELAAGGNMAEIAILLDTETARAPPL